MIAIYANYHHKKLFYVFKPLTILLIISLCFSERFEVISPYQIYIAWGLLFSMIGDVLLLLPERHFVKAIAAFFVTHVLYIAASVTISGLQLYIFLSIPILIYIAFISYILLPRVGNLFFPVFLYIAVLFLLLWQATGRYYTEDSPGAFIALSGITLFIFSDTVLAFNRFVKPVRYAQTIILSSYYFGQTLIALSIPVIK